MNSVQLLGRLTRDPEIREGKDDLAIARFTLAVDRIGSEQADFISCVAFGKTAEFLEDHVTKGQRIALTGRMQTGSYEHKDGYTVYTTDVVAERVYFADSVKKPEEPEPKERGRSRARR